MRTGALPTWLDPESLQWMILLVIAVVLVAMFVVARFVRRVVVKLVLFALLAGLGLSLWSQRLELQDCARTCECRLYGRTVEVPWEQLPDDIGVRTSEGEVGCDAAVDGAA